MYCLEATFSDDSIFSLLGFCFPPWTLPFLKCYSLSVTDELRCQQPVDFLPVALCFASGNSTASLVYTAGSHLLCFWLLSQACGPVSLPIWPQVPKVNSLLSKCEKFIKAVITFASINSPLITTKVCLDKKKELFKVCITWIFMSCLQIVLTCIHCPSNSHSFP